MDGHYALWEGEVRLELSGKKEEILLPVKIFHRNDPKTGCKLLDWQPQGTIKITTCPRLHPTFSGHSSITLRKYPMAVLGGKSNPRLKNLNPFIKVLRALNKLNNELIRLIIFRTPK